MTLATADDSFDPYAPDEAIDAREYLRTLWHDKWRILGLALGLAVVFGLLGAFAISPRFRTEATIALDPVALAELLDTTGQPRDLQADLAAEANVVADNGLEAAVAEQLGFPFDVDIHVTEGSSSSLDFGASAGDAAQAQQALDALVAAYQTTRIELGSQLVDDQISPLRDQIAELQAGRDDASAPLDSIQAQLDDNPSAEYRAQLLEQQANLQAQLGDTLNSFDDQIGQAQTQIQRLNGFKDAIATGTNAQVVQGPTTTQTTPGGARLAAIGFIVGALAGVFWSVGRRVLDKSIRSRRALEAATGHRVLGLIPKVVDWDEDQVQNVALEHPTSPPAEAYRTLRTSLRFLTVDDDVRRILVTSAGEGEGKTTTVANLGVTLARTGKRVLLVDADLRKPRLHEFFGVDDDRGLSDALQGASVEGLLVPVEGIDALQLLPAGGVLADPSEHLGSDRAAEVLAELDGLADLVLFDAPPVLPVSDALEVGRQMDGVLLVATAGRTQPKEAELAAELLTQVGAPLVGSVLNAISRDMGDGYAFEYRYELDGSAAPDGADTPSGDAGADPQHEATAGPDDEDVPAASDPEGAPAR
ncbi:MAG: polysaccharide biosynthesis tyrosine autokinase [Acidimicrobiales bacterium]|nr:polysaccharide biosynthesis tyrosine autokinase [Acidimicrobiales bacterium]MCB1016295.1 polysaccharide biosynthesis tyrosine autokinase [Acidimicrobiales bacterium]MCB9372832.1 polysaccharide biosynthesis tyrosine autokinase [Microthrixaceae bacterium]